MSDILCVVQHRIRRKVSLYIPTHHHSLHSLHKLNIVTFIKTYIPKEPEDGKVCERSTSWQLDKEFLFLDILSGLSLCSSEYHYSVGLGAGSGSTHDQENFEEKLILGEPVEQGKQTYGG